MSIQTSIYDPRTMGTLVSRVATPKTFFLDLFFKNIKTFPTKSVDVDFKKGNRAMAPFVHRKIGGKTIDNKGYETKQYTPPLVAPNKITTIDDILTRAAGENPYSGQSPADRAVAKMAGDFSELVEMITRREEWMAAMAIFSGQIPIIGEGLNEVIDFDFTNTETIVTDALKWTNPGSNPIADIKKWHETVQKTGFVNCDVCVMSSDVASAFMANEKVQKMLDVRAFNVAVIAPRELPNGATYVGTITELGLDIYKYNEWYLDDFTNPDAPEQKPLVPDGKLALLSTKAEYSRYYGAITIIDEKTDLFTTIESTRVPETWTKRSPARRFLQVNSAPLPVPHEVNSWFVATVI